MPTLKVKDLRPRYRVTQPVQADSRACVSASKHDPSSYANVLLLQEVFLEAPSPPPPEAPLCPLHFQRAHIHAILWTPFLYYPVDVSPPASPRELNCCHGVGVGVGGKGAGNDLN